MIYTGDNCLSIVVRIVDTMGLVTTDLEANTLFAVYFGPLRISTGSCRYLFWERTRGNGTIYLETRYVHLFD